MPHQWDGAFAVDDSVFGGEFGIESTSRDDDAAAAVARTIERFSKGP
jgi:hypothetical protein